MRLTSTVLLVAAATVYLSAQSPASIPPRYVLTSLNGVAMFETRDGSVATAQVSSNVSALAIGPADALYMADGSSIRRVASGVVTTMAGEAGETGSADGAGANARFSSEIAGIVVLADGTVIVADTGNHTIRRVAPDGVVSTWAGVPGVQGVAYGRGAAARFIAPVGVAVDASGTVHVVDRACTLRRITAAGDVQPVAGLGTQCLHRDGTGASARLSSPLGIAVGADGVVLVAEGNFTVRRVTPGGAVSTWIRRVGNDGLRALTLTPSGAVRLLEGSYWSTTSNHPASPDGRHAISELAPDGTVSLVATLNTPRALGARGLATDSAGQSYVSDLDARDLIERVAPDGSRSAFIGGAERSPFTYLSDVALMGDGSLVAVDSLSARSIRGIAADGTARQVLHTISAGSLYAIAAVGNDIYFATEHGPGPSVLRRLSQDGQVAAFATLISGPLTALAPSADGSFLAFMSGRVLRISTAGVATVLAFPGTASEGIVIAANGDIYFSELQNHVIRRLTPDGIITTFAGSPGEPGTADGIGSAARFVAPTNLSLGPDGSLFVVDGRPAGLSPAARSVSLRRISPTGEVVTLFTTREHFFEGIAAAPDGSVYVASGEVLRKVVPAAAAPLVISAQPQNTVVQSGSSASFTVTATGGPSPTVSWQESGDAGLTWTSLVDPPASGAGRSTLTLHNVTVAMHGRRYRAVVLDADETTTSDVATLSVTGMAVNPAALRFAVTKDGAAGALVFATPPQELVVTFSSGAPSWTASASAPWISLTLSAPNGTGNGRLRVHVENPDNSIGDSTTLTGAVTITTTDGLSSLTVPVVVTVVPSALGNGVRPIGQIDTPAQNAAGVQGAIAVSGWAVDDIGVANVAIYRNCLAFDEQAACQTVLDQRVVLLGHAAFIAGARGDVEASFASYPQAQRAGWGFLLLTSMLPHVPGERPHGGQGPITLFAVATDMEGHRSLLGRSWAGSTPGFADATMVTLTNDTIAKPFGAIDTPTQGQTVSGAVNNFGWVLTPDPGTGVLIPTDGSTITVYIDGAPVGTTQYDLCRGTVGNPVPSGVLCNDDVSTAFRGDGTRFRNLDAGRGPIALRTISTTALTNGLHTISWGVTDSANRSEGIGSRYFTVLNSSADAAACGAECGVRRAEEVRSLPAEALAKAGAEVYARTGFDLLSAYTPLVSDASGVAQVRIPELGRVELQIPGVTSGVMLVNGESRALPIGVGIDTARGIVTWAPGAGYLGTYRLSFVVQGSTGSTVHGSAVDVTIVPASTNNEPIRMHLDSALEGPTLSERSVRVEGWALDPQSASGSGIGTVHVWGRRIGGEATPVFLGVAEVHLMRLDVARAHGAQFADTGFRLTTTLPPGEWDITAYVWVSRTGRFEDARSVRVEIR